MLFFGSASRAFLQYSTASSRYSSVYCLGELAFALDSAFSISLALTDISLLQSAGGDGRASRLSIPAAGPAIPLSTKRLQLNWRKGTPEPSLSGEDRAALSALAPQRFSCRRWETRKCSKQGTFTLGGIHRYSAGPAWAGKEVTVSLGAFRVEAFDPKTGDEIASYEREWGQAPTDSADPMLQLRLLCLRPGGWRDSVVRKSLPEE